MVAAAIVFRTDPADPWILLTTTLLLTLTGVAASWLPVRRATRVEPGIAAQGT